MLAGGLGQVSVFLPADFLILQRFARYHSPREITNTSMTEGRDARLKARTRGLSPEG